MQCETSQVFMSQFFVMRMALKSASEAAPHGVEPRGYMKIAFFKVHPCTDLYLLTSTCMAWGSVNIRFLHAASHIIYRNTLSVKRNLSLLQSDIH